MIPVTRTELLERIARETARMSYPGSMSRGTTPIVLKGTKLRLEEYFSQTFPLADVWDHSPQLATAYDRWHQDRTGEIAATIRPYVPVAKDPAAIASKFLNTFMHQLMKYESCRSLWPALHLPLDRRVFAALALLNLSSLSSVRRYFSDSPYTLPYETHMEIQASLLDLIAELNCRPEAEFKLCSRIELNWLWI